MKPASGPRAAPERVRFLRNFARFTGLAASSVAVAALVGWSLDVDLLKTVLPGHAAMKANTAMGLLMSGVALLAGMSPRPVASALSSGLSVAVLLLGALVLLEYGSGIVTGLDTLLFDDPDARAEGRVPSEVLRLPPRICITSAVRMARELEDLDRLTQCRLPRRAGQSAPGDLRVIR